MPNLRNVRKYGTEGGVFYGYYTMTHELGRALEENGMIDDDSAEIRLTVPFWEDDWEE